MAQKSIAKISRAQNQNGLHLHPSGKNGSTLQIS